MHRINLMMQAKLQLKETANSLNFCEHKWLVS